MRLCTCHAASVMHVCTRCNKSLCPCMYCMQEGIFVGVISLGYMWVLASQVMWQRYTMFNGEPMTMHESSSWPSCKLIQALEAGKG
jgi:hypothetical protein